MLISPDPVTCTIQISAKIVQLSTMFLSATLSLCLLFLKRRSLLGLLLLGRLLSISSMRPMLLLFYPLIVETFEMWTPFARGTLKDIARGPQQEMGCHLRKLLEI